jgi:hypothetical protein
MLFVPLWLTFSYTIDALPCGVATICSNGVCSTTPKATSSIYSSTSFISSSPTWWCNYTQILNLEIVIVQFPSSLLIVIAQDCVIRLLLLFGGECYHGKLGLGWWKTRNVSHLTQCVVYVDRNKDIMVGVGWIQWRIPIFYQHWLLHHINTIVYIAMNFIIWTLLDIIFFKKLLEITVMQGMIIGLFIVTFVVGKQLIKHEFLTIPNNSKLLRIQTY